MNTQKPPNDADGYARQIRDYAQALSIAKNEYVNSSLASGHTPAMLKMFTDGNLDKRYEKLVDQFELMMDELDGLDEHIVDYVKTIPLAAYDTGCTDAERFLEFLESRMPFSPEQQDYVTCQRSRYALESQAVENRMKHVRFQEMAGLAESFATEWGRNPDLRIFLNPLRVWATFQTNVLLDEDDNTPATVLFYPVHEDIRTAVLEDGGLAIVRLLETQSPLTLDDARWLETGCTPEERIELCHDLASIGLAAFG